MHACLPGMLSGEHTLCAKYNPLKKQTSPYSLQGRIKKNPPNAKNQNQALKISKPTPPSIISSYFQLLLHVFVLKQCTSFLSLLPNWQQEPSQGSPLHKPTLKRKEKTQQKQPLQTVNSKNVVWQHVRSICLLRKYSCHHPETILVSGESGLWMACPGALRRPLGSATAALIPGGFEILLLLLLLFFSPLIFLIL